MRITHRMIADSVNLNLQRSLRRLDHYSNQLSTGKKFQRASENPVGVGRVMSYSAAVNRNEQFRLNMNQTAGWLDNTEGALQNGLDVLQRIRELSVFGANESLTAEDRRAIAPEVVEFIDHLLGIANTETNGLYIFGGHQTLKTPFIRQNMYNVSYAADSGISPETPVTAIGFQNGSYTFTQNEISLVSETASARVMQSFLQGSAESIIGSAVWGSLEQGAMIQPFLQESSTLSIGSGFVTNTPADQDFVLTLTYNEAAAEWDFVDEAGNQTSIAGGVFNHFGLVVDISEIAGSPADGDQITVASGVNSSVLLEISGINAETGRVDYHYTGHQYALDGSYQKAEGTFHLDFNGTAPQNVRLGSVTVNIGDLESMNPAKAAGLRVGDRAVLSLQPGMSAAEIYDGVSLGGEHRGSSSGASFIFSAGALDDQAVELNYFSLDTFGRSPTKGKVFDGKLELAYGGSGAPAGEALTFSYDSLGFPVYYGDNHNRVQEISPHQEMIMNLSGTKAFGANQEIFEAVFEVYRALMDNDREALGGSALGKMDLAVDHLLGRLAEVGARSNRVEAMQSTLFSENLYLREVRSNIEDIDLAYVITEFTMQENAYRAALSTASMMLQPSLVDYLR
jgi:flagellin-like hook-associated protein FlgL